MLKRNYITFKTTFVAFKKLKQYILSLKKQKENTHDGSN